MGRQVLRILVLLCGPLYVPEAAAQPELWSVASNKIAVIDLATSATVNELVFPAGVGLGSGDMSADGRSYLVPVVYGSVSDPSGQPGAIVRIDTTTKQVVEIVSIPPHFTPTYRGSPPSLTVSPLGRWWHVWYRGLSPMATWVEAVRIIDAITGNMSEVGGSGAGSLAVAFEPNGLRRFELKHFGSSQTLAGYPAGSLSPLWETSIQGGKLVATSNGVYVVLSGGDLVRYDVVSGAELARVTLQSSSVTALAHYNGRIFVAASGTPGLAIFDDLTLAAGLSTNVEPTPRELLFDAYRNVGYMFSGGDINYGRSFNPDTLGPGPLRTFATFSNGRLAEVYPPGSVTLVDASSAAGQITVAWLPNPSAATPASFEIWGGQRGQTLTRIDVVSRETRRWTSPPVSAGSYTLAVVARNANGSAAAARLEINVGDPSIPDSPVNLAAQSSDTSVKLTWQPAPSGVAPASYLIEGAAAGSSNFGAVGRSSVPMFVVTGAPAGAWQLRVRGVTAGGSSAPSNVVTVTTSACAAPPAAPSALASLVIGNLVTFAWQPPTAGDPLEYVIEAGSNVGLTNLARLAVISGSASFETAAPAGVYVVRVRARNACGLSSASDEIVVRVP